MLALVKGFSAQASGGVSRVGGELISQVCFAEPIEIHFDGNSLLTPIAVSRVWPSTFGLTFSPRMTPMMPLTTLNAPTRLMAAGYSYAFVAYFDSIEDDIKAKCGRDPSQWPGTLDFARVVRNALAHDGAISYRPKDRDGQSWRGVTLTRADNGRRLHYQDLTHGDLTLLMLDSDLLL